MKKYDEFKNWECDDQCNKCSCIKKGKIEVKNIILSYNNRIDNYQNMQVRYTIDKDEIIIQEINGILAEDFSYDFIRRTENEIIEKVEVGI